MPTVLSPLCEFGELQRVVLEGGMVSSVPNIYADQYEVDAFFK